MKNIIIILLVLSNITLGQQPFKKAMNRIELKHVVWMSDRNLFSSESITSYSLTPPDTSNFDYQWGNSVEFNDTSFFTNYSAPCGVDCFTNVEGTYRYVGANKIEVFVKTISRNGFCQIPSEAPQKIVGIFEISRTKSGVVTVVKIAEQL